MERFALEFAFRAALIVLTTALVLRVLRIRRAAAQHAVWVAAMAAMLVLPVWMWWGPKAALPVLPARTEPAAAMSDAPFVLVAGVPPTSVQTEGRRPWNWNLLWIGIYFAGAGLLLLRLAIGTIRANRLTSASCIVPVTMGWIRPRVILPEGWNSWPRGQLDAVLAHESAHARRRDPLFQWLALFHRALFWFHPAAWWLERRIAALAEEACDEAVLESGIDPRDYSEYLLDMARAVRQAGTRVNVVAMAMPGSYLQARVKKIIDGVRVPRVSRLKMMFAIVSCAVPAALFAAGAFERMPQVPLLPLPSLPALPAATLQAAKLSQEPVLQAQAVPAQGGRGAAPKEAVKLEFEVASIKPMAAGLGRGGGPQGGPGTSDPERFSFSGQLLMLLRFAYGVDFDQISGPDWLAGERFVVSAKIPAGATKEQMSAMLQNLLEQRFHLSLHRVPKEFPVYELVIANGGSKLKETAFPELGPGTPRMPDPSALRNIQPDKDGFPQLPPGLRSVGTMRDGVMKRSFRAFTIPELVTEVSSEVATEAGQNPLTGGTMYVMGRVVDHTGLTGKYDFTLAYTSSRMGFGGAIAPAPAGQDPTGQPDLFDALEKQLGLKLEKTKAPLDVLVIDHIDKVPEEN